MLASSGTGPTESALKEKLTPEKERPAPSRREPSRTRQDTALQSTAPPTATRAVREPAQRGAAGCCTTNSFRGGEPRTRASARPAGDERSMHPTAVRSARGRSAWSDGRTRRRREGLGRALERRFKVTTDSNQVLPIAPNLLNREFSVDRPDKVWAGDITYTPPTRTGCSWP